MTLIADPAKPVRFRPAYYDNLPAGEAVTYWLTVPREVDRLGLHRELAEAGAREVTPDALLSVLRRGMDNLARDNPEVADHLKNQRPLVEAAEEAREVFRQALIDRNRAGGDAPGAAVEAAWAALRETDDALGPLLEAVRKHYGPLRSALADVAMYPRILGTVATRLFVVRADGLVGGDVTHALGELTEETMSRIPDGDKLLIGQKVKDLMSPAGAGLVGEQGPEAEDAAGN